jgi:hypothetical protein
MPQLLENGSGFVMDDLSAIPIGEIRLLLYLDLEKDSFYAADLQDLDITCHNPCRGLQILHRCGILQYTAFILKISPHTVSSPIKCRQ